MFDIAVRPLIHDRYSTAHDTQPAPDRPKTMIAVFVPIEKEVVDVAA